MLLTTALVQERTTDIAEHAKGVDFATGAGPCVSVSVTMIKRKRCDRPAPPKWNAGP